MPAVICMLRGVNLGKRRMKMDALRAMCESLDLEDPRTYVQSGNVVFHTTQRALPSLAARFEKEVEKIFGFRADTILRTPAEMRDIIARNPFAKRTGIEPGKLLVVFLAAEPAAEDRKKISALQTPPEELILSGREIYIYYPNGQARPNLNIAHLDRFLKIAWTGRNWNTVTALLTMAEGTV